MVSEEETWHGKHVKFHLWSPSGASITHGTESWQPSLPSIVLSRTGPTFEMEFSEVGCTYNPYLLFHGGFFLRSLLAVRLSLRHLILTRAAIILGMGRRPWATPEQLEYLNTFVCQLPRAKSTTRLKMLYAQVYEGFLKRWAPPPVRPEPGTSPSPEELVAQAKEKLEQVSVPLHEPSTNILTACQRIINWYGEQRKKGKHSALPYSEPTPHILDLSGKSKRKKTPYQPHQAYSVLYWQPVDSPLRLEVEDLWARRNEDSVHETLKPFLKDTVRTSASTSEKLLFHMAVMRWKCSLLTPDKMATLHNWIGEQQKSADAKRALPWSGEAIEHGDDLFAENTYIQRYVLICIPRMDVDQAVSHSSIDNLALTVQVAIEEIERQTGWKAMVILGGLEPGAGQISSHL